MTLLQRKRKSSMESKMLWNNFPWYPLIFFALRLVSYMFGKTRILLVIEKHFVKKLRHYWIWADYLHYIIRMGKNKFVVLQSLTILRKNISWWNQLFSNSCSFHKIFVKNFCIFGPILKTMEFSSTWKLFRQINVLATKLFSRNFCLKWSVLHAERENVVISTLIVCCWD